MEVGRQQCTMAGAGCLCKTQPARLEHALLSTAAQTVKLGNSPGKQYQGLPSAAVDMIELGNRPIHSSSSRVITLTFSGRIWPAGGWALQTSGAREHQIELGASD